MKGKKIYVKTKIPDERYIDCRMLQLTHERGGLFYKFISANAPGVPDRILITPSGAVWFIELKSESGRLAKIQRWQIDRIKQRGANARVIRGLDEAEKFIEEVMPSGV